MTCVVASISFRVPVLLFCVAIGCTSAQTRSRTKPQTLSSGAHDTGGLSNTDPCATRLHDISGAILSYYALHHTLPATLDQLRVLPGFEQLEYVCPDSMLPYIYVPAGIPAPNQPGAKIVMYDASPAHAGMRWAISITASGAPTTKVIAVPESYFQEH